MTRQSAELRTERIAGGTRRLWAHNPRVVGSNPALATQNKVEIPGASQTNLSLFTWVLGLVLQMCSKLRFGPHHRHTPYQSGLLSPGAGSWDRDGGHRSVGLCLADIPQNRASLPRQDEPFASGVGAANKALGLSRDRLDAAVKLYYGHLVSQPL